MWMQVYLEGVYRVSIATYLEGKADLSGNEFLSGREEDRVSFLFALFISLHFTIQCLSVFVHVCVIVCVCVCVRGDVYMYLSHMYNSLIL